MIHGRPWPAHNVGHIYGITYMYINCIIMNHELHEIILFDCMKENDGNAVG